MQEQERVAGEEEELEGQHLQRWQLQMMEVQSDYRTRHSDHQECHSTHLHHWFSSPSHVHHFQQNYL